MLVKELRKNVYEVTLSDDEKHHFRIIMLSNPHEMVYNVSTLINYLLTWIEQNWFKSILEPETDGN